MSITAPVLRGTVTLPPELNLADGTQVEIIIPSPARPDGARVAGSVRLPAFNGGGLQPGLNLDDSRALQRLLDQPGKLSQLP